MMFCRQQQADAACIGAAQLAASGRGTQLASALCLLQMRTVAQVGGTKLPSQTELD